MQELSNRRAEIKLHEATPTVRVHVMICITYMFPLSFPILGLVQLEMIWLLQASNHLN